MNTPKPMFLREVGRIDDPQFVSDKSPDIARRLIDAGCREGAHQLEGKDHHWRWTRLG